MDLGIRSGIDRTTEEWRKNEKRAQWLATYCSLASASEWLTSIFLQLRQLHWGLMYLLYFLVSQILWIETNWVMSRRARCSSTVNHNLYSMAVFLGWFVQRKSSAKSSPYCLVSSNLWAERYPTEVKIQGCGGDQPLMVASAQRRISFLALKKENPPAPENCHLMNWLIQLITL